MSLTPQDLQAIKGIITENNEVVLAKVESLLDNRLEQQAKEIAQVINQVVIAVDGRVSKLEREVEQIKLRLAN